MEVRAGWHSLWYWECPKGKASFFPLIQWFSLKDGEWVLYTLTPIPCPQEEAFDNLQRPLVITAGGEGIVFDTVI